MFRNFRVTGLRAVAGYGAVAAMSTGVFAACEFDKKGFESTLPSPDGKGKPLVLAGLGMRRKNLYVMEVDVYKVGFYVEPSVALPAIKKAQAAGSAQLQDSLISLNYKGPGPMAAVNLKFVRGVGQDAIVEAFNDAFKGLDADAVTAFKVATKNAIGEKGMANGEEFCFFWYGDERGLMVAKGGSLHSVASSPAIKAVEQRLLGVYLDSKTGVSPELVKSVNENVQSV